MSTLNVHISWECHIYGPIQTCAPSLPFVIGKYFFCASPSFLSRLFSAAAHPNCMRESAQWYGRCNFTTSTPLPLIVHVRAIFLIKWRSSLMSFWYCPTRVFLSGSRNDAWTVKRRENAVAYSFWYCSSKVSLYKGIHANGVLYWCTIHHRLSFRSIYNL